jgi:hypothetical protein
VVPLIQDGIYGSHLEFGFRQITDERFDGLSFFVDWASLGEGSFRKPVLPKIQDGCQVDILDFVFPDCNARTEWQIDLKFYLLVRLHFRGRFLSKTSAAQNLRWPPGEHLGFCSILN